MAQETNTLETRNTGGLLGGLSGLLNTVAGVVTSTAPLAADVYTLKLKGEELKNQSAQNLATLKAEQEKLARAASTPGPAGIPLGGNNKFLVWGAIGAVVLVVIALIFRRRRG